MSSEQQRRLRRNIGPAMQWAKPQVHSRLPSSSINRSLIEAYESAVEEEVAGAVSHKNSDDQSPRQGSSTLNDETGHRNPNAEVSDDVLSAEEQNNASAWKYYSRVPDGAGEHGPVASRFVTLRESGRMPDQLERTADRLPWLPKREGSLPPDSNNDTSSEQQDSSTNWSVYLVPALVIVVLIILGFLTLLN